MFKHSNIIRLRFSRTNFFYERTFVDARWSVFGAHFAERSFGRGLARGSHARMALQCIQLIFSNTLFDFRKSISGPIELKLSGKTLNVILLAPIYFWGVYF